VILIDPPTWPGHGRLWSHLVSDESYAELRAFARELGLPDRAFDRDHYDVPERLYEEAVRLGAVPVRSRELVARLTAAGLRQRKVALPRRAGNRGPGAAGRQPFIPPAAATPSERST
jgi:hypothetical protein